MRIEKIWAGNRLGKRQDRWAPTTRHPNLVHLVNPVLLFSSPCRFFFVTARQQKQHCHAHCDAAGHLVKNHRIGAIGNI